MDVLTHITRTYNLGHCILACKAIDYRLDDLKVKSNPGSATQLHFKQVSIYII